MRIYLILYLAAIGILGPALKTSSNNSQPTESKLLILKLNADSDAFEGGMEMKLTKPKKPGNTMPLRVILNKPMDFGDITFFYEPTGQTVFNATIIWNGTGKISTPDFHPPSYFKIEKRHISMPEKVDSLPYCESFTGSDAKNLQAIWSKISNLTVVKEYMNQHAHIAIYHYVPSVGTFDATAAKWIVFLYVNNAD